jgi:hypothetical protein
VASVERPYPSRSLTRMSSAGSPSTAASARRASAPSCHIPPSLGRRFLVSCLQITGFVNRQPHLDASQDEIRAAGVDEAQLVDGRDCFGLSARLILTLEPPVGVDHPEMRCVILKSSGWQAESDRSCNIHRSRGIALWKKQTLRL